MKTIIIILLCVITLPLVFYSFSLIFFIFKDMLFSLYPALRRSIKCQLAQKDSHQSDGSTADQ